MTSKPHNQKKSAKRESIIFLVVAVLLLAVFGTILGVLLHTPDVSVTPPFSTETTTTADKPVTADPYVRKEGYYTFLIAGVDDVAYLTDVLMLASLDTATGKVEVVQIPRDTFINAKVGGFTTVHTANGIFTGEYNRRVNNGISGKTARGLAMEALRTRLSETLCVQIDEYVLVNTSGFCSLVDAVGGIDFDVPLDMQYSDPEQDLYIDLKKGYQHLNGAQCEQLIRFRSGYGRGDIERMEMRADFLKALFSQVTDKFDVTAMVKLIRDRDLLQKVNTSMSLADLIAYVKMVYGMDSREIAVRTITGEVCQNANGQWLYYCINKKGALADINEALNVYTKDITLTQFDAPGFFTDHENTDNAYIHEYYLSDID